MVELLWSILLGMFLLLAIVVVGCVIIMVVVSMYRELRKRLRQ
jgi:hypothetical protein